METTFNTNQTATSLRLIKCSIKSKQPRFVFKSVRYTDKNSIKKSQSDRVFRISKRSYVTLGKSTLFHSGKQKGDDYALQFVPKGFTTHLNFFAG